MHTHARKPVKEDAANIIMADGGFLGAGSHPQRSEETVDQDVELVDIPVITHMGKQEYTELKMSGFRPVRYSTILAML